MANDSTQTTWFSRMSLVVSWCWKSRRRSAMRAWSLATLRRAFSRFLDPCCALFVAPLQPSQAFLFLPEEMLIARFLPRREGDHIVQPQVEAHRLGGERERGDLLQNPEGDEVPTSRIFGHGNGRRLGIFGQGTTPADGQGFV